MTLPISDFELATDGMKAYAKWGKSVKTVYLYPNNGDAMLQITVHSEVQKNDFEMPTFDGYVIAGIYEDSSLEGDSVTLDFESVTDGASYYIKWESE